VTSIQNIVSGEGCFYVLCNYREGKLGMYLFAVDEEHPEEDCYYYMAI